MLVTLAQVGPVQQGLEVDSTQAQVEVPIRGQVEVHQLDLEVVFTRDLEAGLIRDLGEAHTQAQVEVHQLDLEVDVIAVLVEVARTGGIDLTQIAGEI